MLADDTGLHWLLAGAGYLLGYYPLLLALLYLGSLRQPMLARRGLPWLNLLTAAAGLVDLCAWGYGLVYVLISPVEFEQYAFINRAMGPYWWAYWGSVVPRLSSQWFWWRRPRRSWRWSVGYVLLGVLLPVLERAVLVLSRWHRDYLPSSWDTFSPDAALRWLLGALALGLLLWLRPWRPKV